MYKTESFVKVNCTGAADRAIISLPAAVLVDRKSLGSQPRRKSNPFLRQLCRLKNTLSLVTRGLASTKRGVLQSAACDKREFSIAKHSIAIEQAKGAKAMKELYVRPGDDLEAVLNGAENTVVHLAEGVYRQKLKLTAPGLRLIGAGAEKTVLIYDDYARKLDEQGRELNTFRTWTVAVCADGVSMRDLSIVNDALDPKHRGQEVALSVYGDDFSMENCTLRSTQDTLFLGPLPPDLIERYDGFLPDALRADRLLSQRFRRCRIEGSVDFIFGCGDAVFEDCEIVSVFDGRDHGYVAAPAHAPSQTKGFTFRRCDFMRGEGVRDESIFLARPWRDYGLCRFEDCRYDAHIKAEGFNPWRDSGRDKTARFYETPAQPGRVDWCNRQTEA